MPMRAAARSTRIGVVSPFVVWATWPRQVRESMPMRGVACSHTHWRTCPLFSWAMWPRQVGAQYAKVRGCMQPHALAHLPPTLLGHMAHTSKGQVCQCVWLHAAARIGILVPVLVWATWPKQVGEK